MSKSFYMGKSIPPHPDDPIRLPGGHWYCPYKKHWWNRRCNYWFYCSQDDMRLPDDTAQTPPEFWDEIQKHLIYTHGITQL